MLSAGADIKELNQLTFVRAYMDRFLQNLNDGIVAIRKPIIAAVHGFAVRTPVFVDNQIADRYVHI